MKNKMVSQFMVPNFSKVRNLGFVLVFFLFSCTKDNVSDDIVVITATGTINTKLDEFRQLLGSQLNTIPGAAGGRREINWDAVPAELLGQKLPDDFFNPVGQNAPAARQRGLAYSSVGGEFRVSKNNFSEINSVASNQFNAFSGDKTFANVSSNLWDIGFRVPGQVTKATIKGFGAVFSDVDRSNSTFLEFFNGNESLGKFFVPPHDNSTSFSFIGVYFKNRKVTHVRAGHEGKLIDGENDVSTGGNKDLIILDDFLYDEPVEE